MRHFRRNLRCLFKITRRTFVKNLVLVLLMSFATLAQAKVITKNVEYKDGNTTLEGVVAYDDQKTTLHPGIVVVHDWMGLGEDTINRVKMLADLGYTAFAADIYGKGVRPKD